MAEYLERESILNAIRKTSNLYVDQQGLYLSCELIAAMPAADVQPVKRGKWDGYICSECNVCADYFISGDFYFDEKPDYCPNCGARMDKS